MTDLATRNSDAPAEPSPWSVDAQFTLATFLDLSRPTDYYALHDAHIAACNAGVGPQFRSAIEALGEPQAHFLETMLAANYSAVVAGTQRAPGGYLASGVEAGVTTDPKEMEPELWWLDL